MSLKSIAMCLALGLAACAPALPRAIYTDPAPDAQNPPRLDILHIPSGGVEINAAIYVASGAGPHPTFVLFHGLPGLEKNLDLAQAIRRAGWNVVLPNYRGSWGSPGEFRFAHVLEDADAVLAYLKRPEIAQRCRIDASRMAIGGHSMGGWVTAHTMANHPELLGAVMISAGDLGLAALATPEQRPALEAFMNESRETLAGATGAGMVDELLGPHPDWRLISLAPRLREANLLVLYSDDFVEEHSIAFIDAMRGAGASHMRPVHAPTDHSWSDSRILLQTLIIAWLSERD